MSPRRARGKKAQGEQGPLQQDLEQKAMIDAMMKKKGQSAGSLGSISIRGRNKNQGRRESVNSSTVALHDEFQHLSREQINKVFEESGRSTDVSRIRLQKMQDNVLMSPSVSGKKAHFEEPLSPSSSSSVAPIGLNSPDAMASLDDLMDREMQRQNLSPGGLNASMAVSEAMEKMDEVLSETRHMQERSSESWRESIVSVAAADDDGDEQEQSPSDEEELSIALMIEDSAEDDVELQAPPKLAGRGSVSAASINAEDMNSLLDDLSNVASPPNRIGPKLLDGSFEASPRRAVLAEESPVEGNRRVVLLNNLLAKSIIDEREYQVRLAQIIDPSRVQRSLTLEMEQEEEEEMPPVPPDFPGIEAFGIEFEDEQKDVDAIFDEIINRGLETLEVKESQAKTVASPPLKVPIVKLPVSSMPPVHRANVMQCPACSIVIPQHVLEDLSLNLRFCPSCGCQISKRL